MAEEYLGDGLYAELNAGDIKLRAPRADLRIGTCGDHEVYLDRTAYFKLKQLVEDYYGWK